MKIYAPDAIEFLPDMPPTVGRSAIRLFYEKLFDGLPHLSHEFTTDHVTVSASCDLAVTHGSYRFTPDTREAEVVEAGSFVGVWHRLAGEWRLKLNISNSNHPPRA